MNNRERQMNEALWALADDDRSLNASTTTEEAVMTRWDAAHAVSAKPTNWFRRHPGRTVSWISVAAAAAVLALAVGSTSQPTELPAGIADSTDDALPVMNGRPETDVFIQLVPFAPHELNGSSLQLMRVQLRGDMISRLGVAVDAGRASEVVEADVLFGEDGIARAIRFER